MIKELPHVKATAIDLSLVAPIAQNIVAEEGATDRVQVLAADLLSGPLPGSYDTVIGAPCGKKHRPGSKSGRNTFYCCSDSR
jgi:hypothetical protein